MAWSSRHFLANAFVGCALVGVLFLVVQLFGSVADGGWVSGSLFVAFAAIGVFVGLRSPQGLPGAAVGVTTLVALTTQAGAGPAGQAMTAALAILLGGITSVGELIGAAIGYLRHERARRRGA